MMGMGMGMRMGMGMGMAMASLPVLLVAQTPTLPAGLDAQSKVALEHIIDSARVSGLPLEPLVAKAAEGKLKQASDPQIVAAVRSLANRFRAIRSELGTTLDVPSMTAAATAIAVGIPISAIRGMRDASAGSPTASADLAGALVTATDLVAQRVSPASAVTAVQSLLARRATPEQFARLRAGVGETIASGRAPDQAIRSATESIVKTLPPSPPPLTITKPPQPGDASSDARVPMAPSTTRNPR
jgi:hypothetical protein